MCFEARPIVINQPLQHNTYRKWRHHAAAVFFACASTRRKHVFCSLCQMTTEIPGRLFTTKMIHLGCYLSRVADNYGQCVGSVESTVAWHAGIKQVPEGVLEM